MAACRADQPFEIIPEVSSASRSQVSNNPDGDSIREDTADTQMETDNNTSVVTVSVSNLVVPHFSKSLFDNMINFAM